MNLSAYALKQLARQARAASRYRTDARIDWASPGSPPEFVAGAFTDDPNDGFMVFVIDADRFVVIGVREQSAPDWVSPLLEPETTTVYATADEAVAAALEAGERS
jgi:hypothetical protein